MKKNNSYPLQLVKVFRAGEITRQQFINKFTLWQKSCGINFDCKGTADAGTCDFEGYDNHGRFLAVECKRPVGGKLSPAQEARIDDINAKGGVAFVAHSGEEALKQLQERGCI